MPINGLIASFDTLEFSLSNGASSSNSGTGPFNNGVTSNLTVVRGTSSAFTTDDLVLDCDSATAGFTVSAVTPGGTYSNSGSGYVPKSIAVRFRDVTYHFDGGLRCVVGSTEIYEDGSLASTVSGFTISSSRVTADGLPLLGLLSVEGQAIASGQSGGGIFGAFVSDAQTEATVSGGFRFKETSVSPWESFPVLLPSSNVGAVLSGDTYGNHLEILRRERVERSGGPSVWVGDTIREAQSGQVFLVPNLARLFSRFNTDFALMMRRLEFPECIKRRTSRIGTDPLMTPTTTTDTVEAVGYAAVTAFLMGPSFDSNEQPLADSAKSGIIEGYSYEEGQANVADGDDVVTAVTYFEDKSETYPFSVGAFTNYLTHSVGLLRWINTHGNPHWCFLLKTNPWEVDGSAETWGDYWSKVGSQHLDWATGGPWPQIRNHLWSEGLENDGKNSFGDTFLGGDRWAGVSRWRTVAVAPRTSFVYGEDQESLFSSPDGTVTVSGTDITLAP